MRDVLEKLLGDRLHRSEEYGSLEAATAIHSILDRILFYVDVVEQDGSQGERFRTV